MEPSSRGEEWQIQETEMRMLRLGLILLLCCVVAPDSARAGDPPGMKCRPAVVVRVHPGPAWKQFAGNVPVHLKFLREQMAAGHMLYGGPFEAGDGGLSIFDSSDLAQVDGWMASDPVVAKRIVTVEMHLWKMCAPPSKKSGS
jgi:uncharacterized protein YciI